MVWVYEDPPYTKKEERTYRVLKRKLRDKAFVDKLIKLISLYAYVKRRNPSSAKEIQELAYFDKAKTKPIFDSKTASALFKALRQKGGKSAYPYTDYAVKGVLSDVGSYLPDIVTAPVENVYGGLTSTVETLKENIPFADLAVATYYGATKVGVDAANDLAEGVGGVIGSAVVAPFTVLAAGLASGVATLEGDLGQAVAQMANAVPVIGNTLLVAQKEGETMADKLRDHSTIASYVPYMTGYHASTPAGGKRFSTMRHKHHKWRKTQRNVSVKR